MIYSSSEPPAIAIGMLCGAESSEPLDLSRGEAEVLLFSTQKTYPGVFVSSCLRFDGSFSTEYSSSSLVTLGSGQTAVARDPPHFDRADPSTDPPVRGQVLSRFLCLPSIVVVRETRMLSSLKRFSLGSGLTCVSNGHQSIWMISISSPSLHVPD